MFAAISVLLAALGIHGVVSYGVAQRTREFGLRMALGSTPGQLKRMVIVHGIKTVFAGLAIWNGRSRDAGVRTARRAVRCGAVDPVVTVAVAGLLFAVTLVANYIPAHRATPHRSHAGAPSGVASQALRGAESGPTHDN
ncbi:MAG: FtsX-like permease family protein [Ignavibacteriota bacterium]